MNEIFNPTLVMSIGPSGKKALEHLKVMLRDVPDYLYDVIELLEMNSMEKVENKIQNIIDDKLLNAKKINRLVDLGYKVRTESTTSIKLNIYIYWDVYEGDFLVASLIEKLLHLNYGMVDKEKHSGVCLFLLPVLDKEWAHGPRARERKKRELTEVVDLLCKNETMVNFDSKVYLMHTIARDGLRIPKKELQYILAMVTYLNILPSEMPLLTNYNRRLMMHEKNFKVATLGISTLTVFKERLKEEFAENLSRDLIDYGCSHREQVDYSIYSSSNTITGKNISNILGSHIPFNISNKKFLEVPEKYKISLGNEGILKRQPETYGEKLNNGEDRINKEFIFPLKEHIEKKNIELIDETKSKIHGDLNNVILTYSLIQGKEYLEELKNKVKKESVDFEAERFEKDGKLKEKLLSRIKRYPNFKGFWFKFLIIFLFILNSLLILEEKFTAVSKTMKSYIIIGILFFIVLITVVEYLYMDKRFMKFIKKYIDNIYIYGGATLKKKVAEEVSNYYKEVIFYIEEKIKSMEETIDSFKGYQVYKGEFNKKQEKYDEILIEDLLNSEDRKAFYESSKKYIKDIYTTYMGTLPTYESLKNPAKEEELKEFCLSIASEYVNMDFYDYAKFKWKDNLKVEMEKWMEKSVVKAKELLQFNESYDLEEQKIFVGSRIFVNEFKEIIKRNLKDYKILSIHGKDIYTNSISIVKFSLGIDLNKIIYSSYEKSSSSKVKGRRLKFTKFKLPGSKGKSPGPSISRKNLRLIGLKARNTPIEGREEP